MRLLHGGAWACMPPTAPKTPSCRCSCGCLRTWGHPTVAGRSWLGRTCPRWLEQQPWRACVQLCERGRQTWLGASSGNGGQCCRGRGGGACHAVHCCCQGCVDPPRVWVHASRSSPSPLHYSAPSPCRPRPAGVRRHRGKSGRWLCLSTAWHPRARHLHRPLPPRCASPSAFAWACASRVWWRCVRQRRALTRRRSLLCQTRRPRPAAARP